MILLHLQAKSQKFWDYIKMPVGLPHTMEASHWSLNAEMQSRKPLNANFCSLPFQ